jgi:hypothetical protein
MPNHKYQILNKFQIPIIQNPNEERTETEQKFKLNKDDFVTPVSV